MSEEAFLLGRLLDQIGLNRVGPEVTRALIPRWVMAGLCVGPQAHLLILGISSLQYQFDYNLKSSTNPFFFFNYITTRK